MNVPIEDILEVCQLADNWIDERTGHDSPAAKRVRAWLDSGAVERVPDGVRQTIRFALQDAMTRIRSSVVLSPTERDAAAEENLAAQNWLYTLSTTPAQPQPVADDDVLTAAYMAGYHNGRKGRPPLVATGMLSQADMITLRALADLACGMPAQPLAPEPDWTKAPQWAMWWAVDCDGYAWWYRYEPSCDGDAWGDDNPDTGNGKSFKDAYFIDIPIGIDWRTLKRQRPAPVDKSG